MGGHAIGAAWGSMPLERHGAACHWSGMGRHAIGVAWGSIPKVLHSQGQLTLLDFLNLAIPNCLTYTGGKTA